MSRSEIEKGRPSGIDTYVMVRDLSSSVML